MLLEIYSGVLIVDPEKAEFLLLVQKYGVNGFRGDSLGLKMNSWERLSCVKEELPSIPHQLQSSNHDGRELHPHPDPLSATPLWVHLFLT